MRTLGGRLAGSILALVAAAAVLRLSDSRWLHVAVWIVIVIAVYAAARALTQAAGKAGRALIRGLATGGFVVLYPDRRVRPHRPPSGTWRNALYTGGLGVLQPSPKERVPRGPIGS
jgi:hypothetical protein